MSRHYICNSKQLKFIGNGAARRVYSNYNKTCLKIPIKYCEDEGIMQNRVEAFNIKTAARHNMLGIFPNFKSLSDDGSRLLVEECDNIIKAGKLDDFMKYNQEILDEAGANLDDYECKTPLQRVAYALRVFNDYNEDTLKNVFHYFIDKYNELDIESKPFI